MPISSISDILTPLMSAVVLLVLTVGGIATYFSVTAKREQRRNEKEYRDGLKAEAKRLRDEGKRLKRR